MFLGTDFPSSQVVRTPRFHCWGEGMGSICGWGTKILLAAQCRQKNVFNKHYPFSDIFLCDKYDSSIWNTLNVSDDFNSINFRLASLLNKLCFLWHSTILRWQIAHTQKRVILLLFLKVLTLLHLLYDILASMQYTGLPRGSVVKNLSTKEEMQVRSLGWEDPWRRKRQPCPWGCKQLDET